jgi:hypothetical protein
MIKGPKDILILILALGALGLSIVFLPWSELNFTGNFPDWISSVTSYFGVNKIFAALGANKDLMGLVKSSDAQHNLGDYAYSLFLFGVITASAIAIVLVGKEDNAEKTVLEVKK